MAKTGAIDDKFSELYAWNKDFRKKRGLRFKSKNFPVK